MDEKENSRSSFPNEQLPEHEKQIKLGIWALLRTAFSSERALLAWIRTSVSLYTFGFTITKFMDYLEVQKVTENFIPGLRLLGVILICLGILSLLPAAAEHLRKLRRMKELGLPTISQFILSITTAAALFAIGVVVLVGVVLK